MKKKNRIIVILSVAIVAALVVIGCGVFSFFTYKDEVTNKLPLGEINIELHEDSYPGNDTVSTTNITPNSIIPKNPNVENNGPEEVYVFLRVSVPVESVTEVSADGTKKTNNKQAQELFYLKTNKDPVKLENSFNNNWIRLESEENPALISGIPHIYIFGYNKKLETGQTTDNLFDYIQLKNIIENEILPGSDLNIDIEALAIQSENVGNNFSDSLTKENLEQIYSHLK